MKDLKFLKYRATPELLSLLSTGLNRMKQVTGEDYGVVKLMFQRIIACPLEKLVLVRVATADRPGKASTVAFVMGPPSKILLPDQIEEEFIECCSMIQAVSAKETATFRAFLGDRPSLMHR